MVDNFYLFLPFFLYAEIHYSFKGVYSRLKKNEPEIIADAPHRVEPGKLIPIMILVKDSHKFPVKINKIDIEIYKDDNIILQRSFPTKVGYFIQKYRSIILELLPPDNISGLVKVDVKFEITIQDVVKSYRNNNYRISSHDPLEVYLASQPLPHTTNWYFGDLHYHSSYTEDQTEFGAPLEDSIILSRALGLNFFAVTDHSYDLDDEETSFLKNDTYLCKWMKLRQEVEMLNKNYSDFVILPGEEVSAGNINNHNIHLLIINNKDFIPGKGDSAEKWFETDPDLSIKDVLHRIDEEVVAIAAHPEIPTPFLQWLLIRRGKWQWPDYLHDRLNGMQIWNGKNDPSFIKGMKIWVELLLHRRRIYIVAGNDAHGNFNRFRQIGLPFWTLKESNEQICGKMRTGVKIESSLTLENIISAIRQGHCIITDGPFVEFKIKNETGEIANIGEEISGKSFTIEIYARSTPEFGRLDELKIFYGNISIKQEMLLQKFDQFKDNYTFSINEDLPSLIIPAYLRLELISSTGSNEHRCFTNPIWLE